MAKNPYSKPLAIATTPFDEGFNYIVEIPDPRPSVADNWAMVFRGNNTPYKSAMLELRLITWLGEQNLIDHVDYQVRSPSEKFIYAFKDPKVAMMFKLAWA